MKAAHWLHNRLVTAFVLVLVFCTLSLAQSALAQSALAQSALAQSAKLDGLFQQLQDPATEDSDRITREIWIEWSKSGSPSIDLLLARGQNAMAAGAAGLAIEHFTAVIDHAPDFAEGWNARATAYFQTGNLGPSVSDIAHVLTLNPRHFGALSGLGMIFEQLGKPEKALAAYEAALAINPHLADVSDAVKRLEEDLAGQDL